MCMRPCGPVRRPRPSRRAVAQLAAKDRVIYPTESNITLCRDGQVKVGSHVIGEWTKEEAYVGGFHYRPIYTGGKISYSATIYGKSIVTTSRKTDLYREIAALCKDGVVLSK